ncbi:hypothetical protein [Phreatobacter stygius]|uniref:Uncharacterized protein n=1 Tax=Phreatobacter stygius TaxID=1940610 RepID=A0A4D7AUF0_9HYPH|nr:hypothetical protein [Phreatobacter stygius]QCI63271.1 hypothetical protein E8M01_02905 [Phreatobacter stygius]
MADDFAMNFRRTRVAPAASRSALPLWLLGLAASAIGFVLFSYLPVGRGDASLVRMVAAPSLPPAATETKFVGPRIISTVPGVRETAAVSTTGVLPVGARELAQAYVPAGPVVIRTPASFVEIDGPRLIPPPIGPVRTDRRVLDHAAHLATALRMLSNTPCDQHLRYVAAANINLFVAAYFSPKTPIKPEAPANAAFWSRAEPSMVRRAAVDLAERGALAPDDFGLDRSPEIKGLFQGVRQALPSCA